MVENKQIKTFRERLQRGLVRLLSLITRPFIDFYYNYGLSRASILSYILCVNLVVFVYLFLVNPAIDPVESSSSARRFLELHFLWPTPEEYLIQKVPDGYGVEVGDLLTTDQFKQLQQKFLANFLDKEKGLQQFRGQVEFVEFSLSKELGKDFYQATRNFYTDKKLNIIPTGIGTGFFIILGIAYLALLLNLKTNLAESVSPLIWGNLPLTNRGSQIMKILWRIPSLNVIKSRLYVLCVLPILVLVTVTLLSYAYRGIDRLFPPYTLANNSCSALISFLITGLLFTTLYTINVSGISKRNAAIGAFLAAALWLAGRWLFTTYAGASLYRNLRNFAFVPLFLTWFYYFCTVFLFGLYVSHTIENPNLTSTARSWAMRDFTLSSRYALLSMWVRLDFLYHLARNRYEDYPPPYIGIKIKEDTANEIALQASLPPHFVRECILEMINYHPEAFYIEIEGNRQYCKLKSPPEDVEIMSLLVDTNDIKAMHQEMENYQFGNYIMEKFGPCWNAQPVYLNTVYHEYRKFQQKSQNSL